MWTPPHLLRVANRTLGSQPESTDWYSWKQAIQSELQSIGLGVSEAERFLNGGDLKNAEQALGKIVHQLQAAWCGPNQEGCGICAKDRESDCLGVCEEKPAYGHWLPESNASAHDSGQPSAMSGLGELVDDALRW